ncbi:hypothetical protein ACA910_019987 [Epithemia clementina (nom. ined.)]
MKRFRKLGFPKLQATTLRFETTEQLNALSRFVIGMTGCFGVRCRPPTIKDTQGQSFEEHYALNYMRGSSSVETPYCSPTTRNGIDLTYITSGHLQVSVRATRYLYTVDARGYPKSCPNPIVLDMLLFPPENINLVGDSANLCVTVLEEADMDGNTSNDGESDDPDDISVISDENPPSEQSMFECGTYFRLPQTHTVNKITKLDGSIITAVVVNPGNDLTMRKGRLATFNKMDNSIRDAIKDYYK